MENRFKLAHTGVGKQQPVGWPPCLPEHTDLFPSGKRKSGFPPRYGIEIFNQIAPIQDTCVSLEQGCQRSVEYILTTWKPVWRWVPCEQQAMKNAEWWVTASSCLHHLPQSPPPNLCFSLYLWLFSTWFYLSQNPVGNVTASLSRGIRFLAQTNVSSSQSDFQVLEITFAYPNQGQNHPSVRSGAMF